MFDVGPSELLLIVVVAVVVIGPKDLPRALYKIGQVIGKAKGMARHFRTGIDAMIREAELEELQKQWAKENERIMAATAIPELDGVTKPLADETAPAEALPAPEAAPPPEAAEGAETVPPENGAPEAVASAEAAPDQPNLPLDAPGDAPKGSSMA
ncbi:MAG: twin arginine-targeting protein translocase TatB [Sphingobium sp. 66-54]|nr:MAG: twin arginine-targeting protein translocase TatB [Sphingobium sp. 66-54]